MRVSELIGSITSIFFAFILFFSLASNPPIHIAWKRTSELIAPGDLQLLGASMAEYIWRNLFPALVALILVAVALAVSLYTLLRGGE